MDKDAGSLQPRALLAGASSGAVAVKTSGGSQSSKLGITSSAIVLLGTYPAGLKAGKQVCPLACGRTISPAKAWMRPSEGPRHGKYTQ